MTLRQYLRVPENTHLSIRYADHLSIIGDNIIDTLTQSVATDFKPNFAFLRTLYLWEMIPDARIFSDEYNTLVFTVLKDMREPIYMETYPTGLAEPPFISFFK